MKKLIMLIILFFILSPLPASAGTWNIFTGVVEGKLKNFNKLGQYCANDGRSCVGSKYNEADYSVYQPIRDVKVRVFINGALAGQGTTNSVGYYKISWLYGGWYIPYQIRVETTLEHKDGRFTVFDGDKTPHYLYGYSNIVFQGSSNLNPQNLGTWYWGTANTPISAANIYEAAWRTWHYAFRHSSKLRGVFSNLKIYNESPGLAGVFLKDEFAIYLGEAANKDLSYFRIAHEMGHAASTRGSHPNFKYSGNYCYPNRSTGPNNGCWNANYSGWNETTEEWSSVQFEEGMATFIGNVGAFWSSAPDPLFCREQNSVPCPWPAGLSNRLEGEEPSYCLPSAPLSPMTRQALHTSRYLRDLYDSTNETGDNVDLSFSKMIDGLDRFPSHSWEGGVNEPYAENLTTFDDLDGGRSTRDFQKHIKSVANISTSDSDAVYWLNCTPAGD